MQHADHPMHTRPRPPWRWWPFTFQLIAAGMLFYIFIGLMLAVCFSPTAPRVLCAFSAFPAAPISNVLEDLLPVFEDGFSIILIYLQCLWYVCFITMIVSLLRKNIYTAFFVWSLIYTVGFPLLALSLWLFSKTYLYGELGVRRYLQENQIEHPNEQAVVCAVQSGKRYEICLVELAVRQESVGDAVALCRQWRWPMDCIAAVGIAFADPSICAQLSDSRMRPGCEEGARDFPGVKGNGDVGAYCQSFGSDARFLCSARAAAVRNDERYCDHPSVMARTYQEAQSLRARCLAISSSPDWRKMLP